MAERQRGWDEARVLFPSTEYDARPWAEHMSGHPEVLAKLLGDVYRTYKAERERALAKPDPNRHAGGRRRSYIDGNLDELWSILTPRFSLQPFPQAAKELIGEASLRQFAAKAQMDHRELSRLLRGQTKPTRYWMEAIADAADVHPAYFLEWRVSTVVGIVEQVLISKPHLSISALQSLGRVG